MSIEPAWGFWREGLDERLARYAWRAVEPYLNGESCLELASLDHRLTGHLIAHFERVMAVDPSSSACRELIVAHPGRLRVLCATAADIQLEERFGTVVLDRSLAGLERAERFLAPGGTLIVLAANSLSLHRLMGERDGPPVSDPDALRATIERFGYEVIAEGGTFIQPFAERRLEAMADADVLDESGLDALAALAAQIPRHGSDLFVTAARVPAQ